MKRTISIIASIGLITLLGGTVNAIPPENTPPQPTTTNETTEQIDLGLLVKAITGFLQSDMLKARLLSGINDLFSIITLY
jgi:hypothetical protein